MTFNKWQTPPRAERRAAPKPACIPSGEGL